MTDITKLYPSLPSAPLESTEEDSSQVYRLKKIEEVEQYLRVEIKERDKLAKKFKMHDTCVRYMDHGLLAVVSVITSGVGIGSMLSGIGVPLTVAMGGITIAVGISQAGLRNAGKRLGVKSEKHESIRLLAETKLNSIVDLISKAMENGVISDHEFSLIMQEKQKYVLLKEQARQRTRKIMESINERERQQLVDNIKHFTSTSVNHEISVINYCLFLSRFEASYVLIEYFDGRDIRAWLAIRPKCLCCNIFIFYFMNRGYNYILFHS
ncbi:uncharacterized protein LOC130641560 [Hydractinia symbiolongicarpus]|uniref:uncharacterized protein LOC130641560 n=1 Tax=Hydractinia symbiolongicarpus TaxID=13093 RepID=UPI00255088BB|nr:uncharacterized protein LOC130641560 [Hydractinia symbiolongicarpus]